MRTQSEVYHKLQQRTFRHLKKFLRTFLSERFYNCKHNVAVSTSDGKLFVCSNLQISSSTHIDVSVGRLVRKVTVSQFEECGRNLDQSKTCGCFESRYNKESLKVEFNHLMCEKSKNNEEFVDLFPDLSLLKWLLEDEHPVDSVDSEEVVDNA